jgi:hypothetical protein
MTMTYQAPLTPTPPTEDVVKGAMFALVALPVGVILLAVLSSVGFVASIVGYAVAAIALRLYRRGSGGFISRAGAWAVTGVVVLTLLVGIWVSLVVDAAGGLGHLDRISNPNFWPIFSYYFPSLVKDQGLFILLILAFAGFGSFRILGRAFSTARQPRTQEQLFGQGPQQPGQPGQFSQSGQFSQPTQYSQPTQPTSYQNDVDGAPSGSADDKTKPPTSGL